MCWLYSSWSEPSHKVWLNSPILQRRRLRLRGAMWLLRAWVCLRCWPLALWPPGARGRTSWPGLLHHPAHKPPPGRQTPLGQHVAVQRTRYLGTSGSVSPRHCLSLGSNWVMITCTQCDHHGPLPRPPLVWGLVLSAVGQTPSS